MVFERLRKRIAPVLCAGTAICSLLTPITASAGMYEVNYNGQSDVIGCISVDTVYMDINSDNAIIIGDYGIADCFKRNVTLGEFVPYMQDGIESEYNLVYKQLELAYRLYGGMNTWHYYAPLKFYNLTEVEDGYYCVNPEGIYVKNDSVDGYSITLDEYVNPMEYRGSKEYEKGSNRPHMDYAFATEGDVKKLNYTDADKDVLANPAADYFRIVYVDYVDDLNVWYEKGHSPVVYIRPGETKPAINKADYRYFHDEFMGSGHDIEDLSKIEIEYMEVSKEEYETFCENNCFSYARNGVVDTSRFIEFDEDFIRNYAIQHNDSVEHISSFFTSELTGEEIMENKSDPENFYDKITLDQYFKQQWSDKNQICYEIMDAHTFTEEEPMVSEAGETYYIMKVSYENPNDGETIFTYASTKITTKEDTTPVVPDTPEEEITPPSDGPKKPSPVLPIAITLVFASGLGYGVIRKRMEDGKAVLFGGKRKDVISGFVLSSHTEPLTVFLVGKDNLETVTNQDGFFEFKTSKADSYVIRIANADGEILGEISVLSETGEFTPLQGVCEVTFEKKDKSLVYFIGLEE